MFSTTKLRKIHETRKPRQLKLSGRLVLFNKEIEKLINQKSSLALINLTTKKSS